MWQSRRLLFDKVLRWVQSTGDDGWRQKETRSLAGRGAINLLKLSTMIAVAILVGTEVVGASWAAGWALGGIWGLPPLISRSLEVLFGLSGFVMLFFFMRVALRHEPVRD